MIVILIVVLYCEQAGCLDNGFTRTYKKLKTSCQNSHIAENKANLTVSAEYGAKHSRSFAFSIMNHLFTQRHPPFCIFPFVDIDILFRFPLQIGGNLFLF